MRPEKAHTRVLTAMIPRGWRGWVVQEQVDEGSREDITTSEGEEIRRLKAENRRRREMNCRVDRQIANIHPMVGRSGAGAPSAFTFS